MADDHREDGDNEATRIIRRPGPAQVPVQVGQPLGAPPVGPAIGPSIGSGGSASPARGPIPPVLGGTPPRPSLGSLDPAEAARPSVPVPPAPRPVMTPPARSATPAAPLAAPAPLAPTPVGPAPLGPAPLGSGPLAPTPAAPSPLAPNPVSASPVAPSPVAPVPAAAKPSVPGPVAQAAAPVPAAEPISSPRVASLQPFQVKPAPGSEETSLISAAKAPDAAKASPVEPAPAKFEPTVGWLVVVKGPGRGASRPIVTGRNALGSSPDQPLAFAHGDPVIAPRGHVYVVYDEEARQFYVEDGKQKEIARLNGRLLTETRDLNNGDDIRIGATTFRFVALCGPDFDWTDDDMPKPAASPAAAPRPQPTASPAPSVPASAEPPASAPVVSASATPVVPVAHAPAAATPLTGSIWGEPEPSADPEPDPAPKPSASHASPFDDFTSFRSPGEGER